MTTFLPTTYYLLHSHVHPAVSGIRNIACELSTYHLPFTTYYEDHKEEELGRVFCVVEPNRHRIRSLQ
jgi:hypothetical protein